MTQKQQNMSKNQKTSKNNEFEQKVIELLEQILSELKTNQKEKAITADQLFGKEK